MESKAIFLDKDGTLIKNMPYNSNPALMEVLPGVTKGLQRLQHAGYKLIIVSNQSGVSFGYFNEQALGPVFKRLKNLFSPQGIHFDAIYYCPHHPEGKIKLYAKQCRCRKPLPGLIKKAAKIHNIDIKHSWMLGDILHDVEAGNRAGCKTILVNTGYETEWKISPLRTPNYIVDNFTNATDTILFYNDSIKKTDQKLSLQL